MSQGANLLLGLALLLASGCTTAGYYRRELRHMGRLQERDFCRGILRADPTYYLNRHLGLPTRRARGPRPQRTVPQ